ncbi:MAG: hypothetical protein ACUVXI_16645 [bacterium]
MVAEKLSDIITRVEDRVFHIDRECYIVFTGNSPFDYKPFVRIGNSRRLPGELIDLIQKIIVTDSLTGDITLERSNMNRSVQENQYIGSEETIDRVFGYLEGLGVRIRDAQRVTVADRGVSEKASGGVATSVKRVAPRKSFSLFYDNENIVITYDNLKVFDLLERSRKDLHFLEEADEIVSRLFEGREEHKGKGFLFTDGAHVFRSGGEFALTSLPENYFKSLARLGLNPDGISAAVVERVDSSEAFLLLKRKDHIGGDLTIMTHDPDRLKNLTGLFPDLDVNVVDLTKASSEDVGNIGFRWDSRSPAMKISVSPGASGIGYIPGGDGGVPTPGFFDDCAVVILPRARIRDVASLAAGADRVILAYGRKGSVAIPRSAPISVKSLCPDIPYEVIGPMSSGGIISAALSSVGSWCEEMGETGYLEASKALLEGRSEARVEALGSLIERLGAEAEAPDPGRYWILENVAEFVRLAFFGDVLRGARPARADKEARKGVAEVVSLVRKFRGGMAEGPGRSAVGNVLVASGGSSYIFYTPAKSEMREGGAPWESDLLLRDPEDMDLAEIEGLRERYEGWLRGLRDSGSSPREVEDAERQIGSAIALIEDRVRGYIEDRRRLRELLDFISASRERERQEKLRETVEEGRPTPVAPKTAPEEKEVEPRRTPVLSRDEVEELKRLAQEQRRKELQKGIVQRSMRRRGGLRAGWRTAAIFLVALIAIGGMAAYFAWRGALEVRFPRESAVEVTAVPGEGIGPAQPAGGEGEAIAVGKPDLSEAESISEERTLPTTPSPEGVAPPSVEGEATPREGVAPSAAGEAREVPGGGGLEPEGAEAPIPGPTSARPPGESAVEVAPSAGETEVPAGERTTGEVVSRVRERFLPPIDPYEILTYANEVAFLNGYARIGIRDIRFLKNPDWIFPGNKLVMPEGDVLTVKEGDTIWDIAEARLRARRGR